MANYWHMTPRDVRAAIIGHRKKTEREQELITARNNFQSFLIGHYCMIAFHNPKKYPDKPVVIRTNKEEKVMSDESMEAWARSFCKRHAND